MVEYADADDITCGALARENGHVAKRRAVSSVAPKRGHCGKCQSCVWR